MRETRLLFGRIRSECAEIFAVNAAVIGACGAIAVGARIPCADPKPPQIRKKIAQARVTVSAEGATEKSYPRRKRKRPVTNTGLWLLG